MLSILLSLKKHVQAVKSAIEGHSVYMLKKTDSLIKIVTQKNYDLLIIDCNINMLQSIKQADPRIEIIVIGDATTDPLEAVKQGASVYLNPPVEKHKLQEAVENINNVFNTRRETSELERLLNSKYTFAGIIGKNPKMLEIFSLIRRISPYYRTVTIMGETGTGKELVAKAIHFTSPVKYSPFVTFNCGTVVEGLIESELFGHVKGAFTGAITDKTGLFEAAKDGTIFLDEISELPLSVQPHLLRVLQNGEFRRLGSHKVLKAKCRVIAATNKDLHEQVKTGRFREDLYYRLTPLTLKMPSLREKKDDIPLLSRHFIEMFNKRTGKAVAGISRPAQIAMMSYNWPGNVRELENVIEQAAILTPEPFIRIDDLPDYLKTTETDNLPIRPPMSLSEVEKMHIDKILKDCKGNRTNAAKILGISRRALFRKIKKYGL